MLSDFSCILSCVPLLFVLSVSCWKQVVQIRIEMNGLRKKATYHIRGGKHLQRVTECSISERSNKCERLINGITCDTLRFYFPALPVITILDSYYFVIVYQMQNISKHVGFYKNKTEYIAM